MAKTNGNNGTIKYRVERLEDCYNKMDTKLDKILTNDLPHIKADLAGIKTRVTLLAGINIFAVVIAIVFAYLLK